MMKYKDPDPDPLVRGMDPRIWIRIHTKMSWIRNTEYKNRKQFNIIFARFDIITRRIGIRIRTFL
jgi:hypothetical protein